MKFFKFHRVVVALLLVMLFSAMTVTTALASGLSGSMWARIRGVDNTLKLVASGSSVASQNLQITVEDSDLTQYMYIQIYRPGDSSGSPYKDVYMYGDGTKTVSITPASTGSYYFEIIMMSSSDSAKVTFEFVN